MGFSEDWEREAESWIAWARTLGHDAYWRYRDAFFELVPPAARATLEVGCGEGRVSRELASRGHVVTAIDASPTLVAAASEAHAEGCYLLADAAALPFDDGAFDLVVAFNSLMDIQDMPGAIREAARVLAAGGRICVCVTHPLQEAGDFVRREAGAPFVIEGSYFGPRRFEGTEERNGLSMTFRGWSHSLAEYAQAFEQAGLLIEALREPPMPSEPPPPDPPSARWSRLPMFLMLRLTQAPA